MIDSSIFHAHHIPASYLVIHRRAFLFSSYARAHEAGQLLYLRRFTTRVACPKGCTGAHDSSSLSLFLHRTVLNWANESRRRTCSLCMCERPHSRVSRCRCSRFPLLLFFCCFSASIILTHIHGHSLPPALNISLPRHQKNPCPERFKSSCL